MKYIRTKDGIKRVGDVFTAREKPLKVANNIEDLCDEIMFYDSDTKQNCIITDSFSKIHPECKGSMHLANRFVYGCIWIKGPQHEPILKSVAKLNDKGELELL